MTKTEKLQTLWDSVEFLIEATIEFRPFNGWYVVPLMMRHFTDDGDYLGRNWREAEQYIRKLIKH